jgi:hypothetical protein
LSDTVSSSLKLLSWADAHGSGARQISNPISPVTSPQVSVTAPLRLAPTFPGVAGGDPPTTV